MKTKLLTICLFLITTSTHLQAARPSLGGLQQQVDALVAALLVCPPTSPQRFVDNGDGTICDHQTGLMWEQKDAEDGTQDLSNPHDVDNRYDWTSSGTSANGTAFTDFLDRLNGVDAGAASSEQLGGYSDWRLPTSAELQTLLLEPFPCSISPCIVDPIFAPTAASGYWSSTSFASDPTDAWDVFFGNGLVDGSGKSFGGRVRAVRSGR